MNKILSIILITASSLAIAQISASAKVNLLFPTSSGKWSDIRDTATGAWKESGKNNTGYNVGLSLKIDTPTSFFFMPEIYYTSFKNEVEVDGVTLEAKSNRIDVPILLGYNIVGKTVGAFIGPVASYNLTKDETYSQFKENVKNNFSMGYQFGAQVKLNKFILNGRYEGAFTKDQREFISSNISDDVKYDSRPNLFIVGLGYQF